MNLAKPLKHTRHAARIRAGRARRFRVAAFFVAKLAAPIPRPHKNLVLYHGVLSGNAAWRSRVVAYGRSQSSCDAAEHTSDQPAIRAVHAAAGVLPQTTLTTALCYGWLVITRPEVPHALPVYLGLVMFSCLFITKDELVHAREQVPNREPANLRGDALHVSRASPHKDAQR